VLVISNKGSSNYQMVVSSRESRTSSSRRGKRLLARSFADQPDIATLTRSCDSCTGILNLQALFPAMNCLLPTGRMSTTCIETFSTTRTQHCHSWDCQSTPRRSLSSSIKASLSPESSVVRLGCLMGKAV
jgi:hypothetical protein